MSAFGSKETIIFKDKFFVLTNMNTDPTVLYSLMRLSGFVNASKRNPKAEILATKTSYGDPRRFAGQKPIRISGGTWAEGYGYTRPYNESIFKTSLPTKFKDFSKLAGYPQAPYTNAYYVSEMKSVFGVDAASATDDVLVKAWDYFKEKSKELSDTADGDNKARPAFG